MPLAEESLATEVQQASDMTKVVIFHYARNMPIKGWCSQRMRGNVG